MINGWNLYNSATATQAQKDAGIADAVAAHNTYVNMPAKDYPAVNSWTDSAADAVYTLMGGDGSAYNNAKNGVNDYIDTKVPVEPVVGLELKQKDGSARYDAATDTVTVPTGTKITISDNTALKLSSTEYLRGVTDADVTFTEGEAENTFVATFKGKNSAEPVKVTITVVYLNDTAELEQANDTATFGIDNGDTGYGRKITGVGTDMTWEQLSQAIQLSEKSAGATITIVDTTSGVAPVANAKATTVTVIVTTEYGNEYSYVVQA